MLVEENNHALFFTESLGTQHSIKVRGESQLGDVGNVSKPINGLDFSQQSDLCSAWIVAMLSNSEPHHTHEYVHASPPPPAIVLT